MRRVQTNAKPGADTRGERRRTLRCRPRRHVLAWTGVPALVGAMLLAGVLVPPPASANTLSTLAPHADSTGPVVVDAAGNGYVAWASSVGNAHGDPLYFCKIPPGGTCTHKLLLPVPNGANWDNYLINQPFPVLGGKAGVVSIVAPSYVFGNVVVWTSHNGGSSFGNPQVIGNAGYDGTGTADVLRTPDADPPYYPDYFVIASSNPGLFYTFTGIGAIGARDPPIGFAQHTGSVPGEVASTTVGYGKTVNPGNSQTTQTIEAFSTDADEPRLDYFWSPLPGVSGEPGSLEHGPNKVAIGVDPLLAGGPGGLFLLSDDYVASPNNAAKPLHLDVRKWNPTTETFGAPTLVATVPNDINATTAGGFAEDDSTGALTVAWPRTTAAGRVMQIWTSPSGGAAFSGPRTVGSVGFAYEGPARLATVGGHGFLTWQDSNGLQLVDLAHL